MNKYYKSAILASSLSLSACEKSVMSYPRDAENYQKQFEFCMNLVPDGPKSVVNNDWDEVLVECQSFAQHQDFANYQSKLKRATND